MGYVGGGGCDGLVDGDVLDKVRGGAGIGGVFLVVVVVVVVVVV